MTASGARWRTGALPRWAVAIILATGVASFVGDFREARAGYVQDNLVSDLPGVAAHTDPNLVNPWGIAASATSPMWVADNGTGVSTLYDGAGTPQALMVTVPPPAGGSTSSPTGVVFNPSSDFSVSPGLPARFIFAAEDGTISGWNQAANPTVAILKVDNSAAGANYKGLANGNVGAANFLYAANFSTARIDVFDTNYSPASLAGSFTDPVLPAGFAPFNVQNLGGTLYVAYAKVDATGQDDVPGPGNGFIDRFDTSGNFLNRLVSDGALNSPWGLALAPAGFGTFAGSLLVGNFGDGRINAFDPVTGALLGPLTDNSANPITIPGLWGLRFGNGGDPNTLYFAAGIAGPDSVEDHGLFGSIRVPEPGALALAAFGAGVLSSMAVIRRRQKSAFACDRVLDAELGPNGFEPRTKQ